MPADFPASVFIVLHTSASAPSLLEKILGRHAQLPVTYAQDQEPIEPGRVYIAPPDRHLLVKNGHMQVIHGPTENNFRPAIDPLFRSASRSHGPRVIGVILSGALDDGTHGLMLIKRAGGVAIVQHPDEAIVPNMPLSAVSHVEVDYVTPAADIAALLGRLLQETMKMPEAKQPGDNFDEVEVPRLSERRPPGQPAEYTCPSCGGALWKTDQSGLLHFRCHVGHAFTADALLSGKNGAVEQALWTALQALDEAADLSRRMAERAASGKLEGLAEGYRRRARTAASHSDAIRQVLLSSGATPNGAPPPRPAP